MADPNQDWIESLPRRPGPTPDTDYIQASNGLWYEVPKLDAPFEPPPMPEPPAPEPGALSRYGAWLEGQYKSFWDQISGARALHENPIASMTRYADRNPDSVLGKVSGFLKAMDRANAMRYGVPDTGSGAPTLVDKMANRNALLPETPEEQDLMAAQPGITDKDFWKSIPSGLVDFGKLVVHDPSAAFGGLVQATLQDPEFLLTGDLGAAAAAGRLAKAAEAGARATAVAKAVGRVAGESTSMGGLMAASEAIHELGDSNVLDPQAIENAAGEGVGIGGGLGVLRTTAKTLRESLRKPAIRDTMEAMDMATGTRTELPPEAGAAGAGEAGEPPGAGPGGAGTGAGDSVLRAVQRARKAGLTPEDMKATLAARRAGTMTEQQVVDSINEMIDNRTAYNDLAGEETTAPEKAAEVATVAAAKSTAEQESTPAAAGNVPTAPSRKGAEPATAAPAPAEVPKIIPDETGHVQTTVAGQPVRVNVEPSDLQKASGNYAKGHVSVQGLDITIENPRGTVRRGTSPEGTAWESTLAHDYGYVKGTLGADGDHVDAFVGPNPEAPKVYVVDQHKPGGGAFDEHKAMIGFDSKEAALEGYKANYPEEHDGARAITEMPMSEFKDWVKNGDTKAPLAAAVPVEEKQKPELKGLDTHYSVDEVDGGRQHVVTSANGETLARKRGETLQVTATTTSPTMRGLGEGTARMKRLIEEADAQGLSVSSDTSVSPGAAKVYDRLEKEGYQVTRNAYGLNEAGHLVSVDTRPIFEVRGKKVEKPALTLREKLDERHRVNAPRPETLKQRILPARLHPDTAVPAAEIHTYQHTGNDLWNANVGVQTGLRGHGGVLSDKGFQTEREAFDAAVEKIRSEMREPYSTGSGSDEKDRQRILKWLDEQAPEPAPEMPTPPPPAQVAESQQQPVAPRSSEFSEPQQQYLQTVGDRVLGAKQQAPIKDLRELRGVYEQITGESGAPAFKRAEELAELAVVEQARAVVAQGGAPEAIFDKLVAMYERQPSLKTRTSTSIEQQAYSTPAPLAYVASHLAGIGKRTTVLEPTAGNGMLLIAASPANATVNELNPDRAAALRHLGFDVTSKDAVTADFGPPVQAVIANPPFGVVREADTSARSFTIELPTGRAFTTTEIDHAISLHALDSMMDDGRGVLIVGGITKLASTRAQRSDHYNGAAKRKFYYHLYQSYNVTDHFTVAGELYEKQGAGWPVDVIVIEGRGKSSRALPAVDVPRVYDAWADLKPLLGKSYEQSGGVESRPREQRPADLQRPVPSGQPVDAGILPGRPVPTDSADDRQPDANAAAGTASDAGMDRSAAGSATDEGQRGADLGLQQPEPAAEAGPAGPAEEPAGDEANRDLGSEAADQGRPERPAEPSGVLGKRRVDNALIEGPQQPYIPASRSSAIGTLVPTNMRTAIGDALHALEQRVGSLDTYVARALGYQPSEIGNYFSAEQVDALALALDQIESGGGFIIGDQTGIGKGRVVAGVIRYALKKGLVPIFTTEKPNLYADMFRDLTDIGVKDIRPVMTNGGETVPLDESGNVTLKSPASMRHNSNLVAMTNAGSLGEYNMIFTTYSQMQTIKGSEARINFLRQFASGGVLMFDESHNAGGTDAGSRGKKSNEGDPGKTGRAGFAREIAKLAKAVFYSSATYAKRPSVMDLYFKTDMALAVENDVRKLPAAIAAGGIPLQQVVASMLAQSGQYIRRERSFAGVEYNTLRIPVDLQAAESISTAMMSVNQFSKAKEALVDVIRENLKAEAKGITGDNSTGQAGVDSSNFTSTMHNLINQMLLGLSVDAAADRAIDYLKANEKPVITVANTMGSFIQEYAEEAGLKSGDAVGLTFKDLLLRYLKKERYITIKDVDGKKTRKYLDDEMLGPLLLEKYRKTQKLIKDMTRLESVPISPIDWIHHRLQKAGYKTSEITGRGHTVRYGANGKTVYQTRATKETSIAGRRNTIIGFNNGTIDALVLNQSGSTGLSLHASEKFKDQRRRRMIIAQAEGNIDTHMQMLGRVHRTGQVVAPGYDQLVPDIPAANRPAAVLAKKMASLNANTTGARSSQFSAKDTLDFINQYGDEVVASLLEDLPDLVAKLGDPLMRDENGYVRDEAARKVTGRLPLLPVAEQEAFYQMLDANYRELIARADALGENALEAKTIELDAKPVSSTELFAGDITKASPFAAGAQAQVMDVKRLGKPYTTQQVMDRLADNVDKPHGTPMHELQRAAVQKWGERIQQVKSEFQTYLTAETKRLSESDQDEMAQAGKLAMLQGVMDQWKHQAEALTPGQSYAITTEEGSVFYGVLQKIDRKKGIKLPVARGSWVAHFDVADGMREITFPFSKMVMGEAPGANQVSIRRAPIHDFSRTQVLKLFDEGQTTSREKRTIVTGNLLAGFSKVGKGQITNFTDHEGRIQQGLLMPRSFDLKEFAEEQPVEVPPESVKKFFYLAPQGILTSTDGAISLRKKGDDYMLLTPRSKAEGGKYFLDRGLRNIVGDFTSVGSSMRAEFTTQELPQVLDRLGQMDQRLKATSFKKEAEAAGGIAFGKKPKSAQYLRGAESGRIGNRPFLDEYLDKVDKALSGTLEVRRYATPLEAEGAFGEAPPADAMGAYTDDGTVHFFEWNIPNVAAAKEIFRHEAIGHAAMERSEGFKRAVSMVGLLKDKGGPRITKLWNDVARRDPGLSDLQHRKEVIATMAERGVKNAIIDRAIAGVMSVLRKVGIDTPPSEAELRAMIVLAARQLPVEARELAELGDTAPQDSPYLAEYPQAPEPSGVQWARRQQLEGDLEALYAKYSRDSGERGPKVYEAVRSIVRAVPNSELGLSVKRLLDPVNMDDLSRETARMTTEAFGKLARDTQESIATLEKYSKLIDTLPPEALLESIHAIETGQPQPIRELQPMADTLRSMLDVWREKVQSLGVGALENWIENYFPHIWQDSRKASKLMAMMMGRRPLKGPATFLKKRTIPTLKEGIELGLKPITLNPLTMALIKIREMQRFYTGVRLMQKLKDADLARFVRTGGPVAPGWVQIDDAVGRVRQWSEEEQGFIERGRYVMPENAARIINNHLTGSALANFLPAQVLRMSANILNALQLGFSAFHLGFTTLDAMISKNAVAIERMVAGEPLRAMEALLEANTPIGAGINIARGRKLLKAYTNIGQATPQMQAIVRALEAAGGRINMGEEYRVAQGISPFRGVGLRSLMHDIRTVLTQPTGKIEGLTRTLGSFPLNYATRLMRDLQHMGATMPAWQIPFEIAGRLTRAGSALIMEHIVPMQKLGVFSDLAADYLRRHPTASQVEVAEAMQSIWRSVDNRLGEMVYDNLFWNRTFKDVNMLVWRAVGWNLGTVRELGGGAADTMRLIDKGVREGKISAEDVGHRIPYIIAMTFTTALIGAIVTYLFTGQGPQEVKDYFFPPTGGKTKYGTPQRVSLPSYAKDVYEYAHHPFQTVGNKLNPIYSLINDVWMNEDFQGRSIYNPDAPLSEKAKDLAGHVLEQGTPFSMQQRAQIAGSEEQTPEGRLKRTLPFLGIQVAPGAVSSPEQIDRAQRLRKAQSYLGRIRADINTAKQDGNVDRVRELEQRAAATQADMRDLEREVKIDRTRRKAATQQGAK